MIRPTIQRVKKSTLPERASLNLFTDLLPGFARSPALRLSPTAWAKLLFLRDAGETEVGGFGISAADDLLYVENVQLVRQTCDVASVAFDDESVADYFDRQVDAGRTPSRVGRIWLHTHPGSSPSQALPTRRLLPGSLAAPTGLYYSFLPAAGRPTPGCNSTSAPAVASCCRWRSIIVGRSRPAIMPLGAKSTLPMSRSTNGLH